MTTGAPFFTLELTAERPGSASADPPLPWGGAPWGGLAQQPTPLQETTTIYASDIGYRSSASDSIGVVAFPPVLIEAFQIDRRLNLAPTESAKSIAWGRVRLSNDDGRWDALAAAWNSDGRAVTVKYGEKTLDGARGIFLDPAYSALKAAFGGLAQPWFLAETELQVPLRDATYWIERPVQSAQYGGSGGADGDATLTGTPKPIALGGTASAPIRNVSPVLIDAANLIYQWHDGPGTVVTLYEGAAATWTYDGDATDLWGTTGPAAGHYRTDKASGLFQLGSSPTGTITADVTGEFPTAGVVTNWAFLALYLLTETLALPPQNFNAASFTAAAGKFNYTAGIYFGPNDSPTGDVALSRILGSAAARWTINRAGEIICLPLRALAGTETPVAQLDTTNVNKLTPQPLSAAVSPPPFRQRCVYQHNYTVQTTGLLGAATDAQKQFVATSGNLASATSATIQASYRRPGDPAPFGEALLVQADAQAVVDDMKALWSTRRRLYSAVLPVDIGLGLDLGDVVRLVYPMDDLVQGRLGQVVGEQFRSAANTITLWVLV